MYNNFTPMLPDNAHTRNIMADIRRLAKAELYTDIKSLSYSKFKLFQETGSRTEYENDYMEHRRLFAIYGLMCLWEEDAKWMDKLCDVIWAICDEYTWVLPAHLSGVTDIELGKIKIDLFSAETGMYLSELRYILGSRLPERVSDRMEYELDRRIIRPYLNGQHVWGMNNWSGVCGGAVGCTFIYMGRDKEFAQAKPYLMENMNNFLKSYEEDGCCKEGALYWNFGFSFFCFFAQLLYEYTHGEIDFFVDEKVKKIACFGQNIILQDDLVISFSDAPHIMRYDCGLWNLLKQKYGDILLPDEKYESRFGDGFGDSNRCRFAPLLRNLYWYREPGMTLETEVGESREQAVGSEVVKKTEVLTGPSQRDFVYYEQAEWYIHKKYTYKFAAKGGSNAEPHNHNDVGSFQLLDHGQYILDDVGWLEYTKDYFKGNRYGNMCASSLGHSVPIVCGEQQKAGKDTKAQVLEVTDDCFMIEMAAAYPCDNLQSLIRRIDLTEEGIRLTDTVQIERAVDNGNSGNTFTEDTAGNSNSFVERFVTRIKPGIRDGKVYIADYVLECCNASEIEIRLDSFEFEPRFESFKADGQMETAYIIDFVCDGMEQMEFVVVKV